MPILNYSQFKAPLKMMGEIKVTHANNKYLVGTDPVWLFPSPC
jgi:hypothetical protein